MTKIETKTVDELEQVVEATLASVRSECGAAIDPNTMEKFLRHFERATHRWEKMVYPAMFAFILLALYGFFLIFSLTKDIHQIATSIDPNMSGNMTTLSANMQAMTDEMVLMRQNLSDMSTQMQELENLRPMLTELQGVNQQMHNMTTEMHVMRRDISTFTYQVGRPMSKMNSWMPW